MSLRARANALFSALLLFAPLSLIEGADKTNIVLILADDLGWADLPVYGNTFHETPALDRLAASGMRFTQFYAGAVCSPTRSNIQSGQNEARFGITQHIPGHRRPYAKLSDPVVPHQLPLEVETFAEKLGTAGYTSAHFGKWHLGGEGFGPTDQGWGTALECPKHSVPESFSGKSESQRTADYLADKAVAFIEENRDRPFLLQISHYAVHIALTTTPELLEKYEKKPPMAGYPSRPDYAGLLEELDQSVGKVVDAISRLGLSENTLVVFVSDNGGLEHDQSETVYTSNLPLSGEKGMLYEGGIRVPAIMSWTGTIPAGSVCETPAVTRDLFPTFVDAAGLKPTDGVDLDGESLVGIFRDPKASLARDSLFWHLPHYHHGTPASAIRKGDWKLIEQFEDNSIELYDLANDLGETTNLAATESEKAGELLANLKSWREVIGALMPKMNPNYDPAREREMAKGGRKGE